MIDDIILDKPYANKIELVSRHRASKHQHVIKGINLISLLLTEGKSHLFSMMRQMIK